jgi:hypothetical protein
MMSMTFQSRGMFDAHTKAMQIDSDFTSRQYAANQALKTPPTPVRQQNHRPGHAVTNAPCDKGIFDTVTHNRGEKVKFQDMEIEESVTQQKLSPRRQHYDGCKTMLKNQATHARVDKPKRWVAGDLNLLKHRPTPFDSCMEVCKDQSDFHNIPNELNPNNSQKKQKRSDLYNKYKGQGKPGMKLLFENRTLCDYDWKQDKAREAEQWSPRSLYADAPEGKYNEESKRTRDLATKSTEKHMGGRFDSRKGLLFERASIKYLGEENRRAVAVDQAEDWRRIPTPPKKIALVYPRQAPEAEAPLVPALTMTTAPEPNYKDMFDRSADLLSTTYSRAAAKAKPAMSKSQPHSRSAPLLTLDLTEMGRPLTATSFQQQRINVRTPSSMKSMLSPSLRNAGSAMFSPMKQPSSQVERISFE